MIETMTFQVEESSQNSRLDEFIFNKITPLSRMYLRYLIVEGKCLVNGVSQNTGVKLKIGDLVEIEVEVTDQNSMHPENIPLEIIFEDEEIIVINKAAGMLVHPTKGVRKGTLLSALTYYLNFDSVGNRKAGEFIRIGLVHRLDKNTSGLMVIAKNPRAHKILCKHIQRKIVEKKYFALVEGLIEEEEKTIEAPIGRDEEKRYWQITDEGKSAETRFRVMERRDDATLLDIELITGRTNQIRLHCAHIGHPILGDDIYGGRDFTRLCLHAYRLCFWHPNGKQWMEFVTEIPADFT
ncbi:MAG: RluA family pseudouridine synthase [Acidobacteriota bacterium]